MVRQERSAGEFDEEALRTEVTQLLHPRAGANGMDQPPLVYSACGESTTAQGVLVAALQEVVANADWKELWVLLGQVRVWLERGLPRMQ